MKIPQPALSFYLGNWRRCFLMVRFACLLGLVSPVRAQTLSDQDLAQIRFDQKLNTQVSSSLLFRDELGKQVRLGEYFNRKPILLILGYYQCPMLCTLLLNGMVESAEDMKWSIGREFEVLDVSINPQETPALAASKKRAYLKRYGRAGAGGGWHFLTGNQPAIQRLASEVGFHFAYDPVSKQYAHPSGLVVLTPQGKVSGYLFGVTFPAKDLFGALRRASSSQVASPIQQLILLCFHYNPITGKYSVLILGILRLLSLLTLAGFLLFVLMLFWRGRSGANATSPETSVGTQLCVPPLDCHSPPSSSEQAVALSSSSNPAASIEPASSSESGAPLRATPHAPSP